MAFNINEFRSRLQGGGARSSLFRVRVSNPPNAANLDSEEMSFMVKASSLPASTVGVIDVPYFGRTIKTAGDREFEDWTTTVINDEDFKIRDALERWSSAMASYSTQPGAIRQLGSDSNPYSYVANATIEAFDKEGGIIKTVSLVNCWPQNIGAIELSWENQNQIQEFDVTWSFDYFQSDTAI